MAVFQITLLGDILLVTNILCLILQVDRKDFATVSQAVKSTIAILEDIQNNVNSTNLQNLKKTNKIIQKLSTIEVHTSVSGTTRKKTKLTLALTNEFYKTVIKPFITALVAEISEVFDLSELPVLQALLTLDPKSLTLKARSFRLTETIL